MASSDFSSPPHPSPPPHTFRFVSDAFTDKRPSELPPFDMDFPNVHPVIIDDNEHHCYRASDCFMLFMGKDVIEKLVEWTNARADKYFSENPTKSRKYPIKHSPPSLILGKKIVINKFIF